jgi:hypothetical protein
MLRLVKRTDLLYVFLYKSEDNFKDPNTIIDNVFNEINRKESNVKPDKNRLSFDLTKD